MSDAPEIVTAPMATPAEAATPTAVASPDTPAKIDSLELAFRKKSEWRTWLRAGALFGGVLAWATAVFGGLVEHDLWTGPSAGFGLAVVLAVMFVLTFRTVFREPAPGAPRLVARVLVTALVGLNIWGIYVFITLVVCERSAYGAMLVLGFFGMLTVFFAHGLVARREARPPRDPAIRSVRVLAWMTVLLVSVTALVPPLAEAMARRAQRHDAPANADAPGAND
jgi:hypothetical protein